MAAACCLATKVLLSTSLAFLCIPALPLRLQPAVSFLSITAIATNKPKPKKLGQSPCVWLPFPARADLWPLPLVRFSCWGIHLLLLPPSRLSSTTPSSGKRASQSACLPAVGISPKNGQGRSRDWEGSQAHSIRLAGKVHYSIRNGFCVILNRFPDFARQ